MSVLTDMPRKTKAEKEQFGHTINKIYQKLASYHRFRFATMDVDTKEIKYVYPKSIVHGYVETRIVKGNKRRDICCSDDTLIYTDRGWLRADRIFVGDKILVPSGKFIDVTGIQNDRVLRSVFDIQLWGGDNIVTRCGIIRCDQDGDTNDI